MWSNNIDDVDTYAMLGFVSQLLAWTQYMCQ